MIYDVFYNNLPYIDLHGYDRESARVKTEDFIIENILLKNKKILIIHGIGQGIVKESVYRVLKRNKSVVSYKIDIYNPGCTIVEIKHDNDLISSYQSLSEVSVKKNDTVRTRNADDCAASATFYFDLKNEEIAFITRTTIGYKQFNNYFKLLIDSYFSDFTFEIFLENNVGELKKKLYAMDRIISVESVIIPPNANHSDFANIFGPTQEEFKESGATKVISRIEVPTKGKKKINIKSSYFNRIFFAISKGYATLVAKGRNHNNEPDSVTSEEHAPYKRSIPESEKDDLRMFRDRAIINIEQLLKDKSMQGDEEVESEE